MKKQSADYAMVTKDGVVMRIGVTQIKEPEVRFKGGQVKWFDDNKLLKKRKQCDYCTTYL